MAQQINRTLQEKINKLNDAELNELGSSRVGKKVFIIDDKFFYVDTILNFTISPFDWSPSNGNKEGDKNIVFELKRNFLNLLEVASEGDTLNVKSGDTFLQNTITRLDDEKIQFSGGRTFYFPISNDLKDLIEPTLIDLSYFKSKGYSPRTLKEGDKFKLKGKPYNEDDVFEIIKIDSVGSIRLKNLTDNKEFDWHKFLSEGNKMIEEGNIIFQDDLVELERVEAKPLNMEGDFIGEFLNNNASDLLELEKNNRPLFDMVEMTLNFLNQKFGKGDDITEKVDVVIDNAQETIKSVQGKDPNLIGLNEINVLSNEGSVNLKGNKYKSWTEFNDALKLLYDENSLGYNKVKFSATFDDGKHIIERVDVGVNSFDPNTMKVGEFIERPFGFFDNLDDDIDKYQWDDEIVITDDSVDEITPDDIQIQIDTLKMVMMAEDDAEKIKEIEEVIKGLEISKVLKLMA
jgi:hypothetical protein